MSKHTSWECRREQLRTTKQQNNEVYYAFGHQLQLSEIDRLISDVIGTLAFFRSREDRKVDLG
jgi:hypothetical protein